MIQCEDHEECILTAIEMADRICSQKQLKFTDLRKEILSYIPFLEKIFSLFNMTYMKFSI